MVRYLLTICVLVSVSIAFPNPTSSDVLFSYEGPDTSQDLLELTDFVVWGPSPLIVGDSITVSFKLKNVGQSDLKLGYKGIFAAARDPSNDASFGFSYENAAIKVGQTLSVNASRVLDKAGTWSVWPSYHLSLATGEKLGPENWHACSLTVKSAPEVPPDLFVEKIECGPGNKLSVTIKNVGQGRLPSGWMAVADVYFDEIKKGSFDLRNPTSTTGGGIEEPGGSSTYIPAWDITESVYVRVVVDPTNDVKESDEQNNVKEEKVEPLATRDVTPPLIISGPIVSQITQTSAIISWETNEESDSCAYFSTVAGLESETEIFEYQEENDRVRRHRISLTELKPGATYQFVVVSRDPSGNRVRSRVFSFGTAPLPDKENPSLSLLIPDKLSGITKISADAQDDISVDRVVFFLDGKPMYTDFSPPFEWELDTRGLSEGVRSIKAQAFDAAGNVIEVVRDATVRHRFPVELSPVRVRILTPSSGSEVCGRVGISAEISHDNYLKISRIEFKVDENLIRENNFDPPISVIPILAPFTVTCPWDTGGLSLGAHLIRVRALDEVGNWGDASISVRVVGPPPVSVMRDVRRDNNYFEVTLTIRNDGEADIENLIIFDNSKGFQCIRKAFLRRWDGSIVSKEGTTVNDRNRYWESTFQANLGVFRRGENKALKYYVVPILEDPGDSLFTPSIGFELRISFKAGGREYSLRPSLSWSNSEERDSAFRAADYPIVTCPFRLFENNPEADVNELLSIMAELAREKEGVLGYISSRRAARGAQALKNLMISGGIWSRRLCSRWAENGYLLIVGENEIVPAFVAPCHVHFTGRGTCPQCGATNVSAVTQIRISDYPYADIAGDERPELRVGRIIGRTAGELIIPITTSIHVRAGFYEYDGSDALLVSGPEDTWEPNVREVERGRSALSGKGVRVTVVHTEYWTTEHTMLAEALRIKGPDNGGARFEEDLSRTETRYLAAWLLFSENMLPPPPIWPPPDPENWISFRGINIRRDFGTAEDIRRALRIAERIQADNPSRGGTYAGWTYTYSDNDDEVLRRRCENIKVRAPNKDIIVFLGHGGPGGWGSVLDAWPTSLCPIDPWVRDRSRPIVLAFSCLTGNYEGVWSIARAFLRNGAAAYFGATEVSAYSHMELLTGEKFWEHWSRTSRIGDVVFFLRTERISAAPGDAWWLFFVNEYNLYGDPKFGGS